MIQKSWSLIANLNWNCWTVKKNWNFANLNCWIASYWNCSTSNCCLMRIAKTSLNSESCYYSILSYYWNSTPRKSCWTSSYCLTRIQKMSLTTPNSTKNSQSCWKMKIEMNWNSTNRSYCSMNSTWNLTIMMRKNSTPKMNCCSENLNSKRIETKTSWNFGTNSTNFENWTMTNQNCYWTTNSTLSLRKTKTQNLKTRTENSNYWTQNYCPNLNSTQKNLNWK